MSKKLIAIDAGHGLKTPGKRCLKSLDSKETREWFLNDRIADKLQDLLADYDCDTIRVDDTTGAKDISLANRVSIANNRKADIYISIHHDAGMKGRKGGGTTVYYYSNDPSKAKSLYNHVISMTNLAGDRSSKVIKKGYYVIKYTKMNAFLIENGYMDSSTDVPIILSKEHADKTALGIMNFLVQELSLNKVGESNNIIPNVVTIPFKVKITADVLNIRFGPSAKYKISADPIKRGGVYTIVATDNGWGKLKSGVGWINLKYTQRV